MKNYDGVSNRDNEFRAYNRRWGRQFGKKYNHQLRAERGGKKSVRLQARLEDLDALNELFEADYEEYDYGDY